MTDTSFFIAHGPILAVTIFVIISMGILCYSMDGLWVVSAGVLLCVGVADVYLMKYAYMQQIQNKDSDSGHVMTNAYMLRCPLTLAHAYPLFCIAHVGKYSGTQICLLFGALLLCVMKPIDTVCVNGTDAVTVNVYGLMVDMWCTLMAMLYMVRHLSVVLRNTTGVVFCSLVLVSQMAGSCLLNTHFKYCNTYVTVYTHVMGIGTEVMLTCYLILLVSSQVNSSLHCASCRICNSDDGCFSCSTCKGFTTVEEWKADSVHSTQMIQDTASNNSGI
jgi:hypothetical protein